MTSDQQRQFETQWPALAMRLQRLLIRKRVSPWLVEDLVQETGLRLIKMWPRVDQARPAWPLTATIGLNLLRDELRRGSSSELIQVVPDGPSDESVEERGMARLELRAVGGALSQMPEAQRRAILSDLDREVSDAPVATGVRMMRMRARRKLQHLVDHASLLGVTVGLQVRRVAREAQFFIGRAIPTDADRATAALVGLFAALSFGVAVVPSVPSEAGEISKNRNAARSSTRSGVFESTSLNGRDVQAQRRTNTSVVSGRKRAEDGRGRERSDSHRTPDGDIPGKTGYRLWLDQGTYVQGRVEAGVTGATQPPSMRDQGRPEGIGSANCTVAPGHTGASCSHGGEGWQDRGVHARHQGEAWVAGERVV